jgi:hypothetical protein
MINSLLIKLRNSVRDGRITMKKAAEIILFMQAQLKHCRSNTRNTGYRDTVLINTSTDTTRVILSKFYTTKQLQPRNLSQTKQFIGSRSFAESE